jgi:hypothetical protein
MHAVKNVNGIKTSTFRTEKWLFLQLRCTAQERGAGSLAERPAGATCSMSVFAMPNGI